MAENGYITDAERAAAAAAPLGTTRPYQSKTDRMGSWFIEDVRRELIGKFGETAETGPNSVYAGGLWIRTSIDPTIQRAAERSEEHTSELQSLMRISYAVFCLKKQTTNKPTIIS